MLDLDRRSVLIGSLLVASAAEPLHAYQPGPASARALQLKLSDFFGLDEGAGWLLAERLTWNGSRPSMLASKDSIHSLAAPAGGQVACRCTVPNRALLAIYPSRVRESTSWRKVAGTDAAVLGVRMSAYRAGGQLACLIQRQGASASSTIVLEV